MSFERVKEYFKKHGLEDRITEHENSSATVELAAEAASCEPARIAKTMGFELGEEVILIVTSGDTRIDNRKFKDRFQKKLKMLSPKQCIELVGHRVGGVCPFVVNDGVKVYLDESLKRFDKIYPAAGSSNSFIELILEELEEHSNYIDYVDVAVYY